MKYGILVILLMLFTASGCKKRKLDKTINEIVDKTWKWSGTYSSSIRGGSHWNVPFADSVIQIERVSETKIKILGYSYEAHARQYGESPLIFTCFNCGILRQGSLSYYPDEDSIYLRNSKVQSSSSQVLEVSARN